MDGEMAGVDGAGMGAGAATEAVNITMGIIIMGIMGAHIGTMDITVDIMVMGGMGAIAKVFYI